MRSDLFERQRELVEAWSDHVRNQADSQGPTSGVEVCLNRPLL